jgi:hypothetical protein
MRIIGILTLVIALASCTGDRLRQSGNQQRQTVAVAMPPSEIAWMFLARTVGR